MHLHHATGRHLSEQASSQYRSARRAEETSGWAVGFISFAAIMMLMVGMFQAGLVAIFENEIYVQTRNYLSGFDVTTWGWIHLILGIIVALAGWGCCCRGGPGRGWWGSPWRC
jgi:hypothetical protein